MKNYSGEVVRPIFKVSVVKPTKWEKAHILEIDVTDEGAQYALLNKQDNSENQRISRYLGLGARKQDREQFLLDLVRNLGYTVETDADGNPQFTWDMKERGWGFIARVRIVEYLG